VKTCSGRPTWPIRSGGSSRRRSADMMAVAASLFPDLDGHWYAVRDGDPRALALYLRHYSARKNGPSPLPTFVGPGEGRIVLLAGGGNALFVWRKDRLRQDGQTGVNCSIFRNESPVRSSDLIREACDIAWARWPGERLFTFVWDAKVVSENPGSCYRHAGWTVAGRNKDGRLTILERLPLGGSPSSPNASGYCTVHRGAECSRCRSSRLEREGSHGLAASR
jgi:hypothetical protein